MGSNVFKLPGAGIFSNPARHANSESASANAPASLFPVLSVPSFQRRSAFSLKQASASNQHWVTAARRRAALRLVESHCAELESPCSPQSPPQPLRVLRLVEADQAPGTAGRLRLSGRLADVCAELDRMVAAEPSSGSHALRA